MWVNWLLLILILSFIEISTVNLVSIWFIVSAFVSLILSIFNVPFIIQFAVFVILGVILFIVTKPFLSKFSKSVKTNCDRVIGMQGIVTEEIRKNVIGEVKVDGKKWSAISDEHICIKENVIIDSISGVKLKVHKLKEGE